LSVSSFVDVPDPFNPHAETPRRAARLFRADPSRIGVEPVTAHTLGVTSRETPARIDRRGVMVSF
jgi:hypothetical protein